MPGTTLSVAPGVRWVRMPLPFALDHINLWLLDDGDGVALVDTGVGLPETRALWETLFRTELDGRPLTRVIVTHFHPDHMGNAGWFAERDGVDVWCTEPEWRAAQTAWRNNGSHAVERRLAHYRRHGFADDAIERFRERGHHYPRMVPTLAPAVQHLADGDTVVIGGRRWDVFTVQGHAPDHACLWNREDDVLISGDQVLPKITTNVSVWPERPASNPLREYLDSLERFEPMHGDTLVLPSHGLPFRGLHARLAGLRGHHDARLAETLDALGHPRSGVDLIPILFRRAMDTHQLSFAIGEVLAHLHLLESDGAVTRLTGDDEVDRFQRA